MARIQIKPNSATDDDIVLEMLPERPRRRELADALGVWYSAHHRQLPWRGRKSLYRTWISEIMLQQTQVATVVDYYRRFLKVFPDVKQLAAAAESEVLKLWEGLGYYRRARQLHRAAQTIVNRHGGRFPRHFQDVLALPGIGRYTAGAILSIAAGQRHPILEGNTARLYSRLLATPVDIASSTGQKQLWEFAEAILPHHQPGEFNQALMELGSQICLVRRPRCSQCPLSSWCRARQQGTMENFPLKAKRTQYESRQEVALIVTRPNKPSNRDASDIEILMRQCQPEQRWAGLWDLPRLGVEEPLIAESSEHPHRPGKPADRQPGEGVKCKGPVDQWIDRHQLRVAWRTMWPQTLRHAVTKYRIELQVWELGVLSRGKNLANHCWLPIENLGNLPVNVTARKILMAWRKDDGTLHGSAASP